MSQHTAIFLVLYLSLQTTQAMINHRPYNQLVITMAGNCLRNCNSQVKVLYNKSIACGHTKCYKSKKVSYLMGSQINILLSMVLVVTYGTENRDGITTAANAEDDDKEYMVYAN